MTTSPVVITDAERIGSQRAAAAVLGRLLELAAREGLPVINWTVGSGGAHLAGEPLDTDPASRRAQWTAWRDALGEPDTEREHEFRGGETRLIAVWDRRGSGGRDRNPLLSDKDGYQMAGVVLAASIWSADDEDQAAGQ